MLIFAGIILSLVAVIGFGIAGPMGAPWVPAFKKDHKKVLKDARLKPGQLYIELGCGDGRLIAEAARQGAEAIGYEINPVMWLIAWVRNLRYKSAHIRLGNFWQQDLSHADVVMTFLTPRYMQKLEEKLSKELKPGAVFVSYIFILPNVRPSLKRHHWQVYQF